MKIRNLLFLIILFITLACLPIKKAFAADCAASDYTCAEIESLLDEVSAGLSPTTHASEHADGGNDEIARMCEGVTLQTFGNNDATPDVSNGGTEIHRCWQVHGSSSPTITHFDDGDDLSEFSDGDGFYLLVNFTPVIDFSDNANIEGNANTDFTGVAAQKVWLHFILEGSQWVCVNFTSGMSNPTTLDVDAIAIPTTTSGDQTLTVGQIGLKTDEDLFVTHGGANGEVQAEVGISLLSHFAISFDPDAVCDGAVDRLFLMTVGDDAPHGITIVEWKVSFEADPTTEADLDLKYADAFIGVANAAVIDVLDTTAGVATEDTNANINSGNAVANGKVLYLEFGTAYTETTHQVIFEMWYYAEED
jgi:hypothetical protein